VVHGHIHNTESPKIVKNNLLLSSVVVVAAVVVAAVVRVVMLVVFMVVFVVPPGLLDSFPEFLCGLPAMLWVSSAKASPCDGPSSFVSGVENPHKSHYFPVLGVFLVMTMARALGERGSPRADATIGGIGIKVLLFMFAHF
jgi:hypothetical protein